MKASIALQQSSLPVIYRGARVLALRLPWAPWNVGEWLQRCGSRQPKWWKDRQCWILPRAWFDEVIRRCVERFDAVYVLQPYRPMKKCAPACMNAKGFDCECSCLGAYHGSETERGWFVISDTCAIRWGDRELACRLIERKAA